MSPDIRLDVPGCPIIATRGHAPDRWMSVDIQTSMELEWSYRGTSMDIFHCSRSDPPRDI